MYHALGYSSILVMQATMTFEQKDIQTAMETIKQALQTCHRWEFNAMILLFYGCIDNQFIWSGIVSEVDDDFAVLMNLSSLRHYWFTETFSDNLSIKVYLLI